MNKYIISVDIEGITGVVNRDFANKKGIYHQLGCRYMVSDVNAVVEGILSVDADAYILVRDAHDYDAVNIDLEKLHPKASLLQGWGAQQQMLAGIDNSFKGAFFVGYHAGGQNNEAVLGHTMHSLVSYAKINGKLVNEAGMSALYAGYHDVPVAFISGDDFTISEARAQLGEEIVGVAVKKSFARDSISSLSLAQARLELAKGAADAVTKLQKNQIPVFKPTDPVTLEVGFYNTGFRISVFQKLSEILSFDPAFEFNYENLSVTFSADDAALVLKRLNMMMFLVYGITG